MDLYGQKGTCLPQKIIIHLIELFFLWLSFWLLFQHGGDIFANLLNIQNTISDSGVRRKILFGFNLITFFRFSYMMTFLLKRKIPWGEGLSVLFAFAIYYIGFSLFSISITKPIGWLEYFAIVLFIVGCVLNSGGEILRNNWKTKPENKGKLYTGGFFKYSSHINYFGDILWVTAYAIITGNIWALSIPLMLFCFFAFYNAPMLDNYLKEKYGKEFENYEAKTKMLIPFIY